MTYECLERVSANFSLAISPADFRNDLKDLIYAKLWSRACRYNASLNGIPLTFANIHIFQQSPLVHHTSGMLVINVHADTILFRPQIGNRLLGVVRHLSLDGIVVAVLGIFLGVIRSEDVASLMTFNPETECFQYKSDPETMIQIGNAILFTVTQLHHGGEFFSIRGSMTDIRKEGLCWEEAGHVVYRTPQRKRLRTE